MQNSMCSSWMLIVTVVCGFVTGLVLFSCKHHGQGGQILTQSGRVWLAQKPAQSKQSLFIWVNSFFFGFVSESERMKNPTREQAKGFSVENGRAPRCLPTFRHGRCFSTLCCCSALFLAVAAPNFWTDGRGERWASSARQWLILVLSSPPNSRDILFSHFWTLRFNFLLWFFFFGSFLITC